MLTPSHSPYYKRDVAKWKGFVAIQPKSAIVVNRVGSTSRNCDKELAVSFRCTVVAFVLEQSIKSRVSEEMLPTSKDDLVSIIGSACLIRAKFMQGLRRNTANKAHQAPRPARQQDPLVARYEADSRAIHGRLRRISDD